MAEVTAREIMSTVNQYRALAREIVGDDRCDDVLSEAALSAWNRREHFDPERGPLHAWLHPFVVRRAKDEQRRQIAEARLEIAAREEAAVETQQVTVTDPLAVLVKQFDCSNLIRYVSEFVSDDDWQVMLHLALTDTDLPTIRAKLGLSERMLRQRRAWVRQVAQTVRAALELADRPGALRISEILSCVAAGSESTYELLSRLIERPRPSYSELALQFGIAERTARKRCADLLELVDIATQVVLAERSGEDSSCR